MSTLIGIPWFLFDKEYTLNYGTIDNWKGLVCRGIRGFLCFQLLIEGKYIGYSKKKLKVNIFLVRANIFL